MRDDLGRGHAILTWLEGRHAQPMQGCEIGVRFGHLSAFLLERLPKLHLTMVDPWAAVSADHPARLSGQAWALNNQRDLDGFYAAAMARTDFAADRRRVIRKPSPAAAADIEDASLDFAFVDGDHLYEPCLADLRAWWPKAKTTGLLCGDDWENPIGMGKPLSPHAPTPWGVGEAVREFCRTEGLSFTLGDSRTWYIQKPWWRP